MNRIESGIIAGFLLLLAYTFGAFFLGYSKGQRDARKECASHYQDTLRDLQRLFREIDTLEKLVSRHYPQPANTNRLIVRNANFRDILTSPIMNIKVTNNIFSHTTNMTNSIKQ